MLFWPILGHFGFSVVTLVTSSSNLRKKNPPKKPRIKKIQQKKFKKIHTIFFLKIQNLFFKDFKNLKIHRKLRKLEKIKNYQTIRKSQKITFIQKILKF